MNYCVVHLELTWCCRSVILQKNKQTHRKTDHICDYSGEGELDEDSQKDMSSSYKINEYWACDVLYDKYNIMAAHYIWNLRE